VSAPSGPRPASTSACFTQLRTADSVRSRSRATSPMDRSPRLHSSTTSLLNSGVNFLLFLLAMDTSYRNSRLVGCPRDRVNYKWACRMDRSYGPWDYKTSLIEDVQEGWIGLEMVRSSGEDTMPAARAL